MSRIDSRKLRERMASMPLPKNFLRVNGRPQDLGSDAPDPAVLRKQIEPWLSAVFQSEHLSLLIGSGFPIAVAARAGRGATSMEPPEFSATHAEKVSKRAEALAAKARRGGPNMEDYISAALQLLGGLDVLEDANGPAWREEIGKALGSFALSVLATERGIGEAVDSGDENGNAAASGLVSFLLSFASRAASRDRLNLFTTNYDRLIEFGCDLVGLRPVDRFVGGLAPRFRASRLDVDLHYNPPGIRGEPRYLEGVVRLTKLHGSIDWRYENRELRRVALPFGAPSAEAALGSDAYESLIIYPNPAKDVETLEYPYAELFRDFSASLCRPNSALVTYGYGFGDDHINRIVADMLTIPSTHLVIVAYDDIGDRIDTFLGSVGREPQISLLVGPHLGSLSNLVDHYLPKPAN
ncbi:MAG TPA: SIR2 family protein [Gaiellaceae bacterium]|nr:SIR2 family protein [Gaiellaceae bacterium]